MTATSSPALDVERDAAQRVHGRLALAVLTLQITALYDRAYLTSSPLTR